MSDHYLADEANSKFGVGDIRRFDRECALLKYAAYRIEAMLFQIFGTLEVPCFPLSCLRDRCERLMELNASGGCWNDRELMSFPP